MEYEARARWRWDFVRSHLLDAQADGVHPGLLAMKLHSRLNSMANTKPALLEFNTYMLQLSLDR